MDDHYSIYLHVFPNRKRYVGCTGKSNVKDRWNGGFGYERQDAIFRAICEFGWKNVKHYILFENLSKNEAQIIEAYLIRKWKTNHHSYGYNTIMPKIVIPDGYVLPELHKKRVFDDNHISEEDRVKRRLHNRNNNQNNCGGAHYNAKMVFCIELDEVFPSVTQAAIAIGVSPANIRHCLSGKQQSAGTHYYTGIPLHWEYVNKKIKN